MRVLVNTVLVCIEWSTHNALTHLVLHVDPVNAQDVVAEIQRLKPPLLVQQYDQSTARPVQTLPEQLPGNR